MNTNINSKSECLNFHPVRYEPDLSLSNNYNVVRMVWVALSLRIGFIKRGRQILPKIFETKLDKIFEDAPKNLSRRFFGRINQIQNSKQNHLMFGTFEFRYCLPCEINERSISRGKGFPSRLETRRRERVSIFEFGPSAELF